METEGQFYERRAAEEQQAADRAESQAAQAAHRELASRYAAIVGSAKAQPLFAAE